jgi:hypothetical protein
MIYKTYTTSLGQEYIKIENNDGSVTCIPPDHNNTDYQAYLKWLDGYEQQFNSETHEMVWVKTSDGNTPLPVDE